MANTAYYSTREFEDKYTYGGCDLGAVWTEEGTRFCVWAPTAEKVYVNLYASGADDEETQDVTDLQDEPADATHEIAGIYANDVAVMEEGGVAGKYNDGTAGKKTDNRAIQNGFIGRVQMSADENGTWVAEIPDDFNGVYYTYSAMVDGAWHEACDPYARAVGVNGNRAMVIDLESTNPPGWEDDVNPHAGKSITDAVIYEAHLRDLSADGSSGISRVGKYLSLTERGTKTAGGIVTGLDHLANLGITHLHLMPVYDFGSVDEALYIGHEESKSGDLGTAGKKLYNWGYDPLNYNVPEGSYSTDPYHGEVRVAEMKRMVKSLHDAGIAVVMDVVYNHVFDAENFCFNRLVPGYFSRISEDGAYSNGSGCGNDTASERSMVRKYIVDSVAYWADEYHIDGFRFDLVGLIDVDTVNEIVDTVHARHPDVIFYGEGWSIGTGVTKDGVRLATQANSTLTPGFAYFNDALRDGLRGSVFRAEDVGYVAGFACMDNGINSEMAEADGTSGYASMAKNACNCIGTMTRLADSDETESTAKRVCVDSDVAARLAETVAAGFMGASPWCHSPSQAINYASCHDNLTLFDKLRISRPDASFETLARMSRLAAAVVLLSDGVPFLMAGEEMLRSKPKGDGTYDENSYASGDEVNSLKWSDLEKCEYQRTFQYYRGLIAFRKRHGALRLGAAAEVAAHVRWVQNPKERIGRSGEGAVDAVHEIADDGVLIFGICRDTYAGKMHIGQAGIDDVVCVGDIYVIFNPSGKKVEIRLPRGAWKVCIRGSVAGVKPLGVVSGTVTVPPISAMVLVRTRSRTRRSRSRRWHWKDF